MTAVVLILIVWIAIDYRNQRQRLRELDESGITRRSGRSAADIEMSEPATSDKLTSTAPPRRPRSDGAAAICCSLPSPGCSGSGSCSGDPSKIPSALIGRPAPQTALPPLQGLVADGAAVPGLDPATFKGKVSIVNVWASWCVPCHDEAPLLTELAKDKRLQLIGINYKDAPDNARRFLGRYGNPFGIVGVDGNGRAAIEWGVYGVPETFVVGREGTIVYKLVGPVTPDNIDTVLKAEIDKALK